MIIVVRFCEKAFSKTKNIFFISLFINILLFSLFFIFATPTFEANDDVRMMDIVSGEMTGELSEYMIFINIIVGKFLKLLYMLNSYINWYPVFFYLIYFISATAVLYCFLKTTKNIYGLIFYLLIFSIFEIYFLSHFQFTFTASVAIVSGILLYISTSSEIKTEYYITVTISAILIIIGALIRKNTFPMIMGLSFFLFVFKLLEKPSWRVPIFLLIIILLFFTFNYVNDKYYQKDNDWSYYNSYNALRSKIIDYPYFNYNDSNKEVYKSVGWSENDVKMIRSVFFIDPDVYSKEKLEYVVANIKPSKNIKIIIKNLIKAIPNMNISMKWYISFFLILTILVLSNKKNRNIFLILATYLAILTYLIYYGRAPSRIIIPINFFLIVFVTYCLLQEKRKKYNKLFNLKFLKVTLVFFSIGVTIFSYSYSHKITQINKTQQKKYQEIVTKMKDKNKIYVNWGDAYFHDREVVFFNRKKPEDFNIIIPDWNTYSPHYFTVLSKYDIDNLCFSLVDREDIYLIYNKNHFTIFENFMQEHYNKSVEALPLFEDDIDDHKTYIYKIIEN